VDCGFLALEPPSVSWANFPCTVGVNGERSMKKIALALALVVAGLSLGGCFVGKGKAPAPVVTKG
jgi:hypothetical protein